MTPGQVVSMVFTSVALIGVAGVIVGTPAGTLIQRQVLTVIGQVAASTEVPAPFYNVYPVLMLMALGIVCLTVARSEMTPRASGSITFDNQTLGRLAY